jgi:protocatechuate 3,4-dioxygenase beta subunit
MKWVAGILVATGLAIAGAVVMAQRSAPTPAPRAAVPATLPATLPATAPAGSVDVLLADANNEPVSGAQVYLFQLNYPEEIPDVAPEVAPIGPVTSDANGVAQFTGLEPLSRGRGWEQQFIARLPGKSMGMAYRRGGEGAPIDPPAGPVRMVMSPTRPITGQISTPPGRSADGIQISTLYVQFGSGDERWQSWFDNDIAKFQKVWPGLLTGTSDAAGRFTLSDMPVATAMTFAAHGKGLGEKQLRITAADAAPLSISMQPEAVIRGTLRDPDGKPLPSVPLLAYNETAELHRGSLTATTDQDGAYRFDGLAEGIYALMLDRDAHSEWTMPVRANLRVTPGQTLEGIELAVERGVELKGSVTDLQTRKPIAGIRIAAMSPAETNGHVVGSGRSDAAGQYTIRVPVGKVMLYVMDSGREYNSPPQQGQRVIGISADGKIAGDLGFQLPRVLKRPSGRATLRGVVVDASGKPIAGVRLGDSRVEQWGAEQMPIYDSSVAVSDADGVFTLEVDAQIPHAISISTPDYVGAAEEVTPQPNTVTDLTITATPQPVLSTIEGRVVDPAGAAIADAIIQGFGRYEEVRTDANGAFRANIRRKDPPTLFIRKGGYEYREFTVAPAAKDAKFVLHPTTRPTRALRNQRLPDSAAIIGQPMPGIDVESWVFGQAPPAKPTRPMLVMFTAVFDDGDGRNGDRNTLPQRITKFQTYAAASGAMPVVIFCPESHESAVRAALAEVKVSATIGVDQYLPETDLAYSGLTQSRFGTLGGNPRRTQTFLIGTDGKVQSDNIDINKTP